MNGVTTDLEVKARTRWARVVKFRLAIRNFVKYCICSIPQGVIQYLRKVFKMLNGGLPNGYEGAVVRTYVRMVHLSILVACLVALTLAYFSFILVETRDNHSWRDILTHL